MRSLSYGTGGHYSWSASLRHAAPVRVNFPGRGDYGWDTGAAALAGQVSVGADRCRAQVSAGTPRQTAPPASAKPKTEGAATAR